MMEQSNRMLRIVQDLLTLSSLDTDASNPKSEEVDMANLINSLERNANALSGGKHRIEQDIRCQADLLGSESELCSALSNLVSNAIRYTPAQGRIILRWECRNEGKTAVFSVIDSGIGIAPTFIPRLTERFFRVDSSRSRDTGGTGLGLAIVKHVAQRHQAQLHIQSTPNKGSTFSIHFPKERVRN